VNTHRLGRYFEDVAATWLESLGWCIVARNVRFSRKEVDLVICRGDLVAFVEVKGRRGQAYGSPAEAVTWKKRREIESVARWWVRRHGSPELRYRFDVIGLRPDSHGRITVDHLEDAWRPGQEA
jgi:putative endonuclease